ncbi:hypothetical protein AX769_22440 (plasmid) [Frondihabitans sp. PAMC 28766]|uniref:hypothetical protein n=1 Tax=Frondihabitans sp. PAMC 28766 TaxID=1795630 RepID=UPI00078EAD3D|nr:hypothetical protein [Frondihabitans sp. PAMC 28766]AMM22894.1 hypothetical protein AX769_22440 [Frondihabitans sp. PAMC 28766]
MTRTEKERFWSHVVKGPEADDCWFWTGAISDDGYGRFSVRRDGRPQAVRPQRYAYELVTGVPLPSSTLLLHSCDIPICVHADADVAVSHVGPGTHRENMLDRVQRGRYRNRQGLRLGDLPRQIRVQRSLDLRTVIIEHGWRPELISAALLGVELTHPRLF